MGFWKRLFSKRRKPAKTEENWEEIVYNRGDVDFRSEEQRSRYITGCLEQMMEASKELDLLKEEYTRVTSYLTDMEEVESLPPSDMEELKRLAKQLTGLEAEVERYRTKRNRMSDVDFYSLRKMETEIEEGIEKMSEEEHYAVLVKKDLRRLDGEHQAYSFRIGELETRMSNCKGMAGIFTGALVLISFLLLALKMAFEMEVMVGFFLVIAVFAIAITILFVKYVDADRERVKASNARNTIIALQNKVRIRYVNNRKLLNYLYMKYHVKNCDQLAALWNAYQIEKDERRQFSEAEAKKEYYQNALIKFLNGFRIQSPERWVNQTGAILDPREMVELRHGLILRRQALREQMDYNRQLGENAKAEISDVAKKYPQYAAEILQMTNQFAPEES